METSNQNPGSVIRNKGFLNLWINQILVQLSYNCLNFALLVWVYKLTGSSAAVSLLLFSVYLPSAIFGLFAGILVDISNRKKIIMVMNLALALCFLSLIPLKGSFLAILAIVFLINSLIQFYITAEASAIPLVCSKRQLLSANSLFSITLFGSFLVGFGIAGPLMNLFSIDFVFVFGTLLLSAAFCLSFLFPVIKNVLDPLGQKLVSALNQKNLQQIKDVGIKEITNTFGLIKGKVAVMVSLYILASIQVGIAVLGVLIPSFFEKALKMNATQASLILVLPLGAGMVTGGILIGRFGNLLPKRSIVSGAIITAGLMFLGLGIAPWFIFKGQLLITLITVSFLLGLSMVSIVVPSQTALQEYSPERDRGKVYSALSVLMSVMTLTAVLPAGILADFFGPELIFIAMGFIIVLLGIFAIKPDFYFSRTQLPYKIRQFLGLGHWKKRQ